MDLYLDNIKTKTFLTKKKVSKQSRSYISYKVLQNFIDSEENIRIFGLGSELINEVKRLHNLDKIHLGLRTKTLTDHILLSLPVIRFGNVEIFTTTDTEKYDVKYKSFTGEELEVPEIILPEINILNIKDYKETDKDLLFQYLDDPKIGFDFETWNLTHQKDFFPLGVGISNNNKATYFAFPDRYSLAQNLPFFSHFQSFIEQTKHKAWAYNCPFEMGVLNRMYHKMYEIQDAYILVLMDGNRGSLKTNGQSYLGIRSWDDEIDRIQKYFRQVFARYGDGKAFLSRFIDSKFYTGEYILDPKIEALTGGSQSKKIKKEDSALLGQSLPDLFSTFRNADQTYENWEDRIVRYWGNEWAIIPDSIMGYYCCMDSFITLKLVEKIQPLYTERCYRVHMDNMYLKYCSDTAGQIRINWELKDEVEDYYKKLEFNSKAYLTLMTYNYHKLYFEDIVGRDRIINYDISEGILNDILFYKSYFYLEPDDNRRVKKFIKFVKPDGILDITRLTHIVGKENVDMFMWLESNKISESQLGELNTLLESIIRSQETIHRIIDDYYELNKNMIQNRNTSILKLWKNNEVSLIEFLRGGVFDNKKIKAEILDQLKLYYVDEPLIKYRIKNNFLPTDYVKHVLGYLTLNRKSKDLQNLLKDKTIESEIDERIEPYLDYNFKSAKETLEFGKWLNYFFKEKVFKSLAFYDTYLDQCEEGFAPGLSEFADFEQYCDFLDLKANEKVKKHNRSYAKFYGRDPLSWRFTNFYKELTEKRFINFCKCFSDKEPYVLRKTDNLVQIDEDPLSLFYLDFYDKIIRLYKYATKELSSAIRFINNNSYKIDWESNTLVNGEKGQGPGYYAIPKIIPLSTKTGRFAASIHTIGGGDDGKLLMVNDSHDMIASYFDVSQAEVRMLATMAKDEKLLDIFVKDKDPYKEMAIQAYPYLASKDNAKKLKAIRQDYKGTFLSYLYQAMILTISINTGLPVPVVTRIVSQMDSEYYSTVQWAKDMVWYAKKNGFRKTFFGNKSYVLEKENVVTTAVNHPVQEATTKILGAGYFNIIRTAIEKGFQVRFKYSIHDSCVIMFPIKHTFEMVMLYRKYFRSHIKKEYGVDFKYDLDLFLENHRDHSSFKYNHKKGLFSVTGYSYQVMYFIQRLLRYYRFVMIPIDEKPVKVKDKILENTSVQPGRDHNSFPLERIDPNLSTLTMVCKLERPLWIRFLDENDELFDDDIEFPEKKT